MGKPIYGGQAVIEGVMMRGARRMAVAVRKNDDRIVLREETLIPAGDRWPVLKFPFLRGMVALVESLALGMRALTFSANEAAEDEGEELGRMEMGLSVAVAFVIAIGLFVIAPTAAINTLKGLVPQSFWLNLVEGVTRLLILLLYLLVISRLKDIQRVLQYHGAEHKVIHAFEHAEPLQVARVRTYSTVHPRCGTSFLFFVALLTVFLYSFFGWPGIWERIAIRLALLPVVAGAAYELIRLSGRAQNPILKVMMLPGLWLQRLTTREPEDSQLEVAISAFQAAQEGVPAATR